MKRFRTLALESPAGPWKLHLAAPSPPLAEAVEQLWAVEAQTRGFREDVLPRRVADVIFNLGRPHNLLSGNSVSSFRRAWISGLYQSPFSIESPDPPLLIGARLRPAFQSQLLGHAGSALSGRVLELEEFGVPDVEECRQRMSRMANWGLRFVALEHWLAARLSAGSAPDAGLVWASSQLASGTRAIAELRRELGWSHRLFIARFRETIGLAPKQFGRLARFARLLDSAEAAPHQNWADLSASAGFFDQAHCIREFHSFAGVTPAEYIRLRDASNQSISLQTVE